MQTGRIKRIWVSHKAHGHGARSQLQAPSPPLPSGGLLALRRIIAFVHTQRCTASNTGSNYPAPQVLTAHGLRVQPANTTHSQDLIPVHTPSPTQARSTYHVSNLSSSPFTAEDEVETEGPGVKRITLITRISPPISSNTGCSRVALQSSRVTTSQIIKMRCQWRQRCHKKRWWSKAMHYRGRKVLVSLGQELGRQEASELLKNLSSFPPSKMGG